MKVLLVMVIAAGLPAWADTLQCGAVVRHSVQLGHDMTCPGTALYVGAPHITIDLQGHTIRWAPPSYANPSQILFRGYGVRNDGVLPDPAQPGGQVSTGGGYEDVRIVNGTIEEFNAGVYLATASGNTITGLNLSRQRRRPVTNGYIDGVGIIVSLASENLLIENNLIENNDRGGIAVDGLLCGAPVNPNTRGSAVYGCSGNVIRANTIRNNNITPAGAEIYGVQLLQAAGVLVTANVIGGHVKAQDSLYNAAAIVVVSSRGIEVAGNELNDGQVGLLLTDLTNIPSAGVTVAGNVAHNNLQNGFEFRSEAPATVNEITARVENNQALGNGGSGFLYEAGSRGPAFGSIQLEANQAANNEAYGVNVPGAFDLGGNRSAGNRIDDCIGVVCQ